MDWSIFLVERPFAAYGPSHWVVLGLFAAGAGVLVHVGRRQRGTTAARRFSRGFAIAILAFQLPLQVFSMLPPQWGIEHSLPLQLCDLAWMAGAWALWSGRSWACALIYYWGLTLTTQALVTPALPHEFPHVGFIMFWGMHLLIVWAAIYLTWGLGRTPDWSSYRIAAAVTGLWAVSVFLFNSAAGTNYGYLNEKPPTASVLDVLGPWPWYVLAEAAIILPVWALMTWPWARLRRA